MTTITEDTKDLSAALDTMREKTRSLNDSVKTLSQEGFGKLTDLIGKSLQQGRVTQKSSGDIALDESQKFLKREIPSLLQSILGGAGKAASADGASVVINNNAGASVQARETEGPFNEKYLEITIDQMVANSLVSGRQTSGVLKTLFGLAPGLIGR